MRATATILETLIMPGWRLLHAITMTTITHPRVQLMRYCCTAFISFSFVISRKYVGDILCQQAHKWVSNNKSIRQYKLRNTFCFCVGIMQNREKSCYGLAKGCWLFLIWKIQPNSMHCELRGLRTVKTKQVTKTCN